VDPVPRHVLIEAGKTFVRRIICVRGVERVALVGSVATEKSNPKDIDFLLTVGPNLDIQAAATAGRKLKGHLQGHASGADVFLCNQDHEYIGRTCNYRECHTRVACEGADCRPGSWLKTDFHLLKLEQSLCKNPPVTIWPVQEVAVPVPADVQQMLDDLRVELEEQGRVA
jgi:hypothetical protein